MEEKRGVVDQACGVKTGQTGGKKIRLMVKMKDDDEGGK